MTLRMRAEVRDAWADALESGKYRQAKGGLQAPGSGYCCLGVLCEVAIASGVDVEVTDPEDGYVPYDNETSCLPERVAEWAGLVEEGVTQIDPYLTAPVTGRASRASTWNDDSDADFAQIARMVRAIPAVDA